MVDKIRIEINTAEVGRRLKGADIAAVLESMGASVDATATATAGGSAVFGHETTIGRNRVRCTVWTQNWEAMYAEAKDRVLTRAIDAARR